MLTDVRLAQTGDDGRYAFAAAPSLDSGESYRVWYRNEEEDPDRLSFWRGPAITGYREGQAVHGGDFDIANVPLLLPKGGATVALPATFEWQARTGGSYSYRWLLRDESADLTWQTRDLGDVSSYTLKRMPDGASLGQEYWWFVRVFQGEDSFGSSRYMRQIHIDSGAGPSPSPSPTTEASPLSSDDFCDPSSRWPAGDNGRLRFGYLPGPPCAYYVCILTAPQAGAIPSGYRLTGTGDHALTLSGSAMGAGRLGLMFGMTPTRDRYYVYMIDTAGKHGLYRNDSGQWVALAVGALPDGIDTERVNSLRVECRGQAMRLLLDDVLLDVGRDAYTQEGGFGVYAESQQVGFEARFTTYAVTTEKGSEMQAPVRVRSVSH